MVSFIQEHYESIRDLCLKYKVERLELFGSAVAEESFDSENSDLDFLVEFLPLEPPEHARCYFGLLEALQDMFSRPIDLVETKAIKNPYLLKSINRSKRQIYAA